MRAKVGACSRGGTGPELKARHGRFHSGPLLSKETEGEVQRKGKLRKGWKARRWVDTLVENGPRASQLTVASVVDHTIQAAETVDGLRKESLRTKTSVRERGWPCGAHDPKAGGGGEGEAGVTEGTGARASGGPSAPQITRHGRRSDRKPWVPETRAILTKGKGQKP